VTAQPAVAGEMHRMKFLGSRNFGNRNGKEDNYDISTSP